MNFWALLKNIVINLLLLLEVDFHFNQNIRTSLFSLYIGSFSNSRTHTELYKLILNLRNNF